MEVTILAQVVFSWSLLVVSENYLSVEAMLQSPPVLSLGGMCFVRKLLEEWVGEDKVGLGGPFDWAATTPEIVRHILADDFQQLLTPSHFIECHSHDGKVRMQHDF